MSHNDRCTPTLMAQPVEHNIHQLIEQHFNAVETTIPGFYKQHLTSPRTVLGRHWRHRADIPREIGHAPLRLYQWGKSKWHREEKASDTPSFSTGKEKELQSLLINELLRLPQLEADIQTLLLQASPDYQVYQRLLAESCQQFDKEQVMQAINQTIEKLVIPRDGCREVMTFLALGAVSNAFSQQVAFGSSMGIGSALAGSFYAGHQSWLGALWLNVTGVPGWVTVAGASMGAAFVVLSVPLVSPLSELVVNRLRGEKLLHKMVTQARHQFTDDSVDAMNVAGTLASYLQVVPDLVQALRSLKA